MVADATAQGLVRLDAEGRIEPGLAERWIVTDAGLSYIFRLRPATWVGGGQVTAEQVATALRRRLRPANRNPLGPYLSAVIEVVAMTPRVLEVRLSRERPDLLSLFAQPEMSIMHPRRGGSGPMRLIANSKQRVLEPIDGEASRTATQVVFKPESAEMAVARYVARESDLVIGGSFADWPLVAATRLRGAAVRVDPAVGLFGLAVVDRTGFLETAANRNAVSAALDRAAIVSGVAPRWSFVDRLLPDTLDTAAPPVAPDWAELSFGVNRAVAKQRVKDAATPVRLRIALPRGPGATRLYGRIAASLLGIGVTPVRVNWSAPADLRLVDEVAPYDSARWYLATACRPCGPEATAAILQARDAPTMAARGVALARADRLVAEDGAFMPIARPFRWSLVSPRLDEWQPNARAWHPLNRLRREAR